MDCLLARGLAPARHWHTLYTCERGSTIRPGLRRFELRCETEERVLVTERRRELDAEREASL